MRVDPFEPLTPDDDRYVARPREAGSRGGGGDWLAKRIQRGLCPILLVGHPGLGKSTELARAAAVLAENGGFAVLLDLATLRHGSDPDRVLFDVATETVQWWVQQGPDDQPSPFLVQDLRASDPHFPQGQGRTLSPLEMARAAWDELTGAADVERLPLLVDGLDALDPDTARAILSRLLELQSQAELVVVGAPAVAVGSENLAVVDRFRMVVLDPLDPESDSGRDFLRAVARAHLSAVAHGEDDPLPDAVVDQLVAASGGVLRDLLGLVRDAWAYADDTVDEAAIADAIRDRVERFRRLLHAGDRNALRAAHGTDGLEVPADRKVRLLQHGLLLEQGIGEDATVRLHPLVARLIDVG